MARMYAWSVSINYSAIKLLWLQKSTGTVLGILFLLLFTCLIASKHSLIDEQRIKDRNTLMLLFFLIKIDNADNSNLRFNFPLEGNLCGESSWKTTIIYVSCLLKIPFTIHLYIVYDINVWLKSIIIKCLKYEWGFLA